MTADDLHRRGTKASAVALHESGHVLAAYAARPDVQIVQASIAPPGVRTRRRRDVSAEQAEILEKLIVVDLAGGAAEREAGFWPDCDAISTDERNVTARALTIVARRRDLERGGEITGEMVAEAENLVESLRPRAEELVAANWPAVERVAQALDQHKTLDVAAIEELLEER